MNSSFSQFNTIIARVSPLVVGVALSVLMPQYADAGEHERRCYDEGRSLGRALDQNTEEARAARRCEDGDLERYFNTGYNQENPLPSSDSTSGDSRNSENSPDSNLTNILRQNGLFTTVPCNSTNVVNVIYGNGNNVCAAPSGRFGPGSYFIGSDYSLYPVGINSRGNAYAPNQIGPVPTNGYQQQPSYPSQVPTPQWHDVGHSNPSSQPNQHSPSVNNLQERW